MRGVMVIILRFILLVCLVQAGAQEFKSLVNKLAGKLVDRALNMWTERHTNLDDATFAKASGHVAQKPSGLGPLHRLILKQGPVGIIDAKALTPQRRTTKPRPPGQESQILLPNSKLSRVTDRIPVYSNPRLHVPYDFTGRPGNFPLRPSSSLLAEHIPVDRPPGPRRNVKGPSALIHAMPSYRRSR